MKSPLRSYNLKQEETLALIRTVLEANMPYYSKVRIRCVAVKTENDATWHNALCLISPFPKGVLLEEKTNCKYDSVHLFEYWLNPENLKTYLDQITRNKLIVDKEQIRLDQQAKFNQYEYLPSNNNYSPYPGYLYSISRENINIPQEPLLAFDLPFYSNLYVAMQHWCDIKDFHGHADARTGSILLFLPECRARFERFTQIDNKLHIEVTLEKPKLLNLHLKGAWKYQETSSSFDIPIMQAAVAIDLPATAEEFEAYIIGPDETIYDYHREGRFRTIGQNRILKVLAKQDSNEAKVRTAIRMGEGESIEFKSEIKPGNPKQEELIETAIAFANTRGGTIFIGIDDHCVIKGIERELATIERKNELTQKQALEDYIGQIRQIIVGTISKPLPLEFASVVVDDHTILLLEIPIGENKPYAHKLKNAIYVRRGASNVFPDPDSELPQLYESIRKTDLSSGN
ncbi:MAG: ATP-binding protein [Candidatus Manganitrophus sp.]|nr:MAG: ATP-binding protein [Candidatus Manganitrophus sp.]